MSGHHIAVTCIALTGVCCVLSAALRPTPVDTRQQKLGARLEADNAHTQQMADAIRTGASRDDVLAMERAHLARNGIYSQPFS